MPIGTSHVETGVLALEGRALTLQRDGGGRWRLDAPRRLWRLVGRRVRLSGTRVDFDWLAVDSFDLL